VASRILVADDDALIRQAIAELLQDQGYEVETAAGGTELMHALDAHTPDLLLLDNEMPDADGLALLERIKSDTRWRDLPVMMVSSHAHEDTTERTFGLGAADSLRKPFEPRDLVARVQAQLRLQSMLARQREALKAAEAELQRAREDAESRRRLVDILHEVTGDVSTDEIYHILVRRVARALSLSRCSVILAAAGDATGIVATAFDRPGLHNERIELAKYPEIQRALATGEPLLIADIQSSPLYDGIRREWASQGTQVPVRSIIALPFSVDREQAGVFLLRRMLDEPPLTTEDVEFAGAVIRAAVAAIQRARVIELAKSENERLEVLAHTDPLTLLLNRRALTERLAAEVERSRRYSSALSLLMVDLDHFKDVNDQHGHLVGDVVLRAVAEVLQQAVRSADVVARYGGEEFVVVLPETPLSGARVFAERIRAAIAAFPFAADAGHGPVQVTASVGIAVFPSDGVDSVGDLLARADEALYRAKSAGRNRVST
jgi:two-component system, cell cycle response regulator